MAGVIMGEASFRLGRYRLRAEAEAEAFALVSDAAGLVAMGSEATLVIEALATELSTGLGLRDCAFLQGPPSGDVPFVARDGTIVHLDSAASSEARGLLDLPIWSSGEITARFRLHLGAGPMNAAHLRLAVSIADQASAALHARDPVPPPEGSGRRRLRLVRG